jgi:hypothetical protein
LRGWSGVVIAGGAAAGHPFCTRARAIACGTGGTIFDAVRDAVCGCDGVKLLALLPDMFL